MSGSRGVAASDVGLQLKVGLINNCYKYLTAETFGFKINASSTTFRKKQLWTIEPDANEADTVYVRSHLGRYLSGDKKVGWNLQYALIQILKRFSSFEYNNR